MILEEGLCFDDVLLKPRYSDLITRSAVNLSVKLNGIKYNHPIVPANMKTIISEDMVRATVREGGLCIIHRFDTQINQEKLYYSTDFFKGEPNKIGVSIGTKLVDGEESWEPWFLLTSANIVCIDVAHGDQIRSIELVAKLHSMRDEVGWPKTIIAGNVATYEGARRLFYAGADVVKCGIGPGSLCSTRIETGNGVPQLTAISEVNRVRNQYFPDRKIIADGGIKSAGDIVKALAAGADFVMIGNLFAGCKEAPGEIVSVNDVDHKRYEGSSTHKENHIEGVRGLIKCTGYYSEVLNKLLEGVRSGLSYQGCRNIDELHSSDPIFIKMSNSGFTESKPHDIVPA